MDNTTMALDTRRHIAVPARLRKRPRDHRGFLVPYFVAWLDDFGRLLPPGEGTPDFRVVDTNKHADCIRWNRCWLCGDQLGKYKTFVLGPMCCINRLSSEPPSHLECAEYAVRVCPFLIRPRMRRNEHDLPDQMILPAGLMDPGNPGTMALWTSHAFRLAEAERGNPGRLIIVGDPVAVTWWHEGRLATPVEAADAMRAGMTKLAKIAADQDGPDAVEAVTEMTRQAERWLPRRVEP
jgi:hypothetical protein